MSNAEPNAAVLLIGNELLSGHTQDANLRHIALGLGEKGVRLVEARVVPDIESRIIGALNALRTQYSYVFVTGGIGPTHDDITIACVAKAFGKNICPHPEAVAHIKKQYGESEVAASRLNMARMPEGCGLLKNDVKGGPGFYVDNVFVMAGIPLIMRSMFADALRCVKGGVPVKTRSVTVEKPESAFAETLKTIQEKYAPDVDIGSYPAVSGNWPQAQIVLRGTDEAKLDIVLEEVKRSII